MNNIIKLLLLSSVEGNNSSPPEDNLTQTKLGCSQLEGSQRDTCSGLSSKDQTEFLSKLKDQIDSLSEGSAKGHIKTVVSIDSYVVDEASCADKTDKKVNKVAKKAAKQAEQVDEEEETAEEDSDASDAEDDEGTQVAKKDIKLAKQEIEKARALAAQAAAKEAQAKAKADEEERIAQAKAAKEAAQAARQAKQDEEQAKLLAKKEADDARRRAAEAAAEAKRKAQAETDAIQRKELEAEAAAAKKQAEEEAAAKELEQRKIAEAIRKAKEEEAAAKKDAELEAAAAKKKAEDEAAAAEAEEAKRKEQEALQALEAARKAKLVADAKAGKQVKKIKNKEGKVKVVNKVAKNNTKNNRTKEFIKKDRLKNSTNSTKAAVSDDEADEEEQEMEKANKKAVSAKPKVVKKAVTDGDDEEEDAKAAEEAAKKALLDAEEDSAEKAEKANKKAKKESKLEKKAEAAEDAAEKAETDAQKLKAKAAADNDKAESDEAEEAEALAKEKRLQAQAAQRKAAKAAAAAKKATDDSATCKIKEANEAKTEDAAEKALKDAERARRQAKNATKKAKNIRKKKEAETVEGEKEETEEKEGDPEKEQASSSEDEEEKKRKEAEVAQAKADAEAMAIRLRKEKIRKELAAAEEAAKLIAEKQAREAADKARREAAELERKAQEAAEKARVKQEAETRKAAEEAARLEKQKAIEAEEKRKAKIAAEAEARRAEAEAKEKEQRAIRLAKEAERKEAEEKAAKEAAIRAERVAFLDKLPSQVMKGSDKRFTNNEQFSIIQYSNQKLNLMRGKYTFKARTYQDAFERFADLIKPIMMKDTHAEFGLVGNKKLLATTSLFNENLKDKKVKVAGEEYKSDKISMMMLGLGLREDIIGWADGMVLEGKEYMMISYDEKNATIKLMGENYAQAKKDFDAVMKKNGTVGILIDWNHQFKHWSADYNLALQALSHYCFSKGFYQGVVFDETAAGFLMEWQTQEKIDAKIKSITGQFSGDGSVFASQQYFYIWKWSAGRVSFVQRGSFWKMGDAYSWYIQYCTEYLKRDYGADLLLVGSNTPMLSTAEWNSDINKLMIGKSIAEGTISLKSFYEGQAQQYYMLLMNKATSALKIEALGVNSNKAYQSFGTKTAGGSAGYWGILFNSNGKIYKIVGDNSNKIYTGDYWGYWVMTEYIQTSMQRWTTYVHNEQECHITLKKEEDARKLEQDVWRREFASRIMRYGEDLIDNFNGTGYRFAKNEKFIGIRYNAMKNEINYWSFFQNNMDRAYETFGKQIKMWATRNYKDTRYNPEEYFLFGNNRLLLSSLSTISQEADGMNITNAVIGWAYDKQLYTPDDGLLDPDAYKQHWSLLQDRKTNKTTMAKCEQDLNRCSIEFEKATEYFGDEPKKGSRGVLLRGPKDSVKKFSVNEDITFNSTSWNFKWSLYSLVGEFMAANNDGDFDSYYVPDESSAGFEIKAPYYKNKRLFHSMVNMKQANNRYFQVHGWWNTYYLKGPVTYYGEPAKWWKESYGNLEVEKKEMVQILMADVDKYSSKPVMVYKPGQMLNDTRMFINYGELARVKQYAPNNCSYKVGKGENIKMVHKDLKTDQIVFSDTKTTNWDDAKGIAADTWKESTGEIWLIYTDQKVYNIYKDNQNPLGELAVLGQWIFESCPDYQHMHPTDVELGFPTIYEH